MEKWVSDDVSFYPGPEDEEEAADGREEKTAGDILSSSCSHSQSSLSHRFPLFSFSHGRDKMSAKSVIFFSFFLFPNCLHLILNHLHLHPYFSLRSCPPSTIFCVVFFIQKIKTRSSEEESLCGERQSRSKILQVVRTASWSRSRHITTKSLPLRCSKPFPQWTRTPKHQLDIVVDREKATCLTKGW